jgi:hypothetical protein
MAFLLIKTSAGVDSNDKAIKIGKPASVSSLEPQTGTQKCGSKYDGMSFVEDTDFHKVLIGMTIVATNGSFNGDKMVEVWSDVAVASGSKISNVTLIPDPLVYCLETVEGTATSYQKFTATIS